MKALFPKLLILVILGPGANAQTQESLDTRAFIDIATRTAILEVKTAKLALKKSNSVEIKAYAGQMLNDHQLVLNGLRDLAIATRIPVADENQFNVALLTAGGVAPWLDGEKFDTAYSNRRLQERRKLVALIRKGLESDDINVRNFAETALPISLQQLYLAQQLPADNT